MTSPMVATLHRIAKEHTATADELRRERAAMLRAYLAWTTDWQTEMASMEQRIVEAEQAARDAIAAARDAGRMG